MSWRARQSRSLELRLGYPLPSRQVPPASLAQTQVLHGARGLAETCDPPTSTKELKMPLADPSGSWNLATMGKASRATGAT